MTNEPTATYRLQLTADFPFDAAAELVPYLAWLGVSHLYCSPVLAAAPGSTHGYDVVDPQRVNPELGGDAARRRLLGAARGRGLGIVQDIVPNHVSVARPELNPWWWDVLRNGPESAYAPFFDIEWADDRLLLPVLAEAGDLDRLEVDRVNGEPVLRLDDRRWPIRAGTRPGPAREVHDQQWYELAAWRREAGDLNYRRFFDVSDLAAVRVEDPTVFEAVHALPLSWARAGEIAALRVDHPDGLADPSGYLARLAAAAPGTPIVVEKILGPAEPLPEEWPVAGTTGYEALRVIDGVYADPSGEDALTELWREVSGGLDSWPDIVHDCKLAAATGPLAAETNRLARLGADPAALAEVLACFPVYRSYLPAHGGGALGQALGEARRRRPDLGAAVDLLGRRLSDPRDELAVRFQQTSGMVMAKGVEDTAFYRYHRLVCLNEVGGDPSRFGVSPAEFHAFWAARERTHPAGMTPLTTHDTKRSEDVRARLLLLPESADQWAATVRGLRSDTGARLDPATGHLLHQTVLGAWPIPLDRLARYMEKATREAKLHTSWTDPEPGYDRAVQDTCAAVLESRDYVRGVTGLVAELAAAEAATIRSRTLLAATVPGVPDIYRGCETGCRTLVDPDNRAPLDLARLTGRGEPKQALLRAALLTRRERRIFPGCGYEPLATGTDHVVGFRRGDDVVVLAGRLLHRLAGRPTDGLVPLPASGDGWHDRIGGRRYRGGVPVADVAAGGGLLLVRESAGTMAG